MKKITVLFARYNPTSILFTMLCFCVLLFPYLQSIWRMSIRDELRLMELGLWVIISLVLLGKVESLSLLASIRADVKVIKS